MVEEIKPQRQGKEAQEDFIVVEIGSSSVPLLSSAVLMSDLHAALYKEHPNFKYVAIDVDGAELSTGRSKVNLLERMGQLTKDQIQFVRATGEQLPFNDNSVSEVIMKNVVGGFLSVRFSPQNGR